MKYLIVALLIFTVYTNTWQPNSKFSLEKIETTVINEPRIGHSEIPESIDTILGQNFHYLAKGSQAFAFESEDKKSVIKFFKNCRFKPSWYVYLIPQIPPFNAYHNGLRRKELEKEIEAYQIALEKDAAGCGLIYVQFTPWEGMDREVTFTDQHGKLFTLNLKDYRFLIQEKVEILSDVVDNDLKNGDVQSAIAHLNQVKHLYLDFFEKGFYDRGVGFMHNNGFYEGKPVHFDAGKVVKNDKIFNKDFQERLLAKSRYRIQRWLAIHHPEYQDEVMLGISL